MSGEASRAQGRAVTLALALILCLNQPRAEQNADLERAGKLFDEKKYEEALGLYSRVIQAHPDTSEARKADIEAARCLEKLDRTDEAIARLEQAIQKYAGKPERASALLAFARVYGPRRALKVYETLISDHPDTPEASEGQLGKARCLRDLGREPESLVIYEEIIRQQAGTEYAARALMSLGLYYEQREDRTRARSYYQKIVDEYPEDWRWTRYARSSLESLDRYFFSPLYDKLKYRIEHHLLGENKFSHSALALGLTSYTVKLGALALALCLLWLCRMAPGTARGEGILRRNCRVATVRPWVTTTLDSDTPWLWAIAVILIGAFAEECVYRGAVYQAFRARTAPWIAAAISALLFAQVHVRPLWPTISTFAVGVILARVVEKTRSLTPATLLHGLINFLVFAVSR